MTYHDIIKGLKQDPPDAGILEEAMDIIADYEKVTEQLSIMMQKYETVKDAISRGMGVYQCPDCGTMVNYGNEHCRNCGRRLGWMPGAKPSGKRKIKRY